MNTQKYAANRAEIEENDAILLKIEESNEAHGEGYDDAISGRPMSPQRKDVESYVAGYYDGLERLRAERS
jgi:hypothetical protein